MSRNVMALSRGTVSRQALGRSTMSRQALGRRTLSRYVMALSRDTVSRHDTRLRHCAEACAGPTRLVLACHGTKPRHLV